MRKLLFSALISSLFCTLASAQTIKETIVRGDSFAFANQYDQAIALYDRARYFGGDSLLFSLCPRIGHMYFAKGDFERAANVYGLIINSYFIHDSSRYDLVFEKANAEIRAKRFDRAERTLELIDTSRFRAFHDRRIFYTACLHYAAHNFDPSESEFIKLADDEAEKKQIEHLFKKLRRSEKHSPLAAFFMSVLLPGAGQFYAGRPEDGINSLLLTGAWAALSVSTAETYGIFVATATAFPWLLRYYSSGAENAMMLTAQMKKKKRERIYKELLKTVGE